MEMYYKRLIEGTAIPAIIHNMEYYYISMPVFEDGSMDCWERINLKELQNKLAINKLVTAIPDGKNINIHGLGTYVIHSAKWQHTPKTYYEYVYKNVQNMNHEMINLFNETKEQQRKWESHNVAWSTGATPYKVEGEFGYDLIDGASTSVFYHSEGKMILTSMVIYEDGTFFLEETKTTHSLEEIEKMLSSGVLVSKVSGEFTMVIPNFATLTVSGDYQTSSYSKFKEIKDLAAKVTKSKTSLEICRESYYHYLVHPSEITRESLRKAYEAVPEHQRIYLGDMDARDTDYRRIIYNPNEKREI
ncbi:hypothetical protein HCB49_11295 [Listeria sp. FSL L7-0123]|uniref:Uncharacterized protein n=1 Tax=Listeria cossartiae subsp. cayugensis TaxID=2713505 RepID=A0A7X0ZEW8_9LIST|nr:hypothetical protein [Listeria cossartiae]MBC2250574.1 hypothetical protein [Listeria cossartiae subsp. cayugensis]